MSALLASYFAELLNEHQQNHHHDNDNDNDDDDDSENDAQQQQRQQRQLPLPELIDDNARLPSPCFGRLGLLYMGTDSEVIGSCHTRSTTSTYGSTISDVSTHSNMSVGSTGSNSSAGSCRWDSNPSSSSKVVDKSDQLKRPKRPGRKMSDNNKNRSSKPHQETVVEESDSLNSASHDRPINRPSRSNSNNNNNNNNNHRRRTGVPQRPTRSTSSECKQTRTTTTAMSKHHHRHPHHQHDSTTTVTVVTTPSCGDSLDKMLLCSKQKALMQTLSESSPMSDHSNATLSDSSEHSLKEIFRTASHQRQRASGSGGMMTTNVIKPPIPGTTSSSRTSPPRSVNDILGQSMEELKISW